MRFCSKLFKIVLRNTNENFILNLLPDVGHVQGQNTTPHCYVAYSGFNCWSSPVAMLKITFLRRDHNDFVMLLHTSVMPPLLICAES